MVDKQDILNGEPINGHILIRVDIKQVKKDLGMAEDSPIILAETQERQYSAAASKGIVVKMATDAFGAKYKERFGHEINPPEIGDIVHFVPYQSNKMDKDGEYYLITDDGVKFIQRTKK